MLSPSNWQLGLLSPIGKACQQIWSVKHDIRRTVHAPFAVRTWPHLTLVVFLAYANKEATIINRLREIGSGIKPFSVGLQNFGGFFETRTLYINVVTPDVILNVLEELKQAKHLLKLNVGYAPKFSNNPHVSICRGMNDWQYTLSWSKYSTHYFNESFVASSMTLLKRVPNEHACKLIGEFLFLDKPTTPTQGSLFM